MAFFFTTKHTMASIDIIKSQLSKLLKWLSIIVSIIFAAYYAFLIYINLDSVFYIVAYSVLLAASLAAFICEILLNRPNKYDSKLVKKIKTKHKKNHDSLLTEFQKTFKFNFVVLIKGQK